MLKDDADKLIKQTRSKEGGEEQRFGLERRQIWAKPVPFPGSALPELLCPFYNTTAVRTANPSAVHPYSATHARMASAKSCCVLYLVHKA